MKFAKKRDLAPSEKHDPVESPKEDEVVLAASARIARELEGAPLPVAILEGIGGAALAVRSLVRATNDDHQIMQLSAVLEALRQAARDLFFDGDSAALDKLAKVARPMLKKNKIIESRVRIHATGETRVRRVLIGSQQAVDRPSLCALLERALSGDDDDAEAARLAAAILIEHASLLPPPRRSDLPLARISHPSHPPAEDEDAIMSAHPGHEDVERETAQRDNAIDLASEGDKRDSRPR